VIFEIFSNLSLSPPLVGFWNGGIFTGHLTHGMNFSDVELSRKPETPVDRIRDSDRIPHVVATISGTELLTNKRCCFKFFNAASLIFEK
jgi:hypothetical protein